MRQAVEAMKKAYAPYSHFQVGAALLAASGKIYQGCNIENAAYTPTNCAERTEFEAICIVGGPDGIPSGFTAPCGVCRQVMMEFCRPETFQVLLTDGQGQCREYTLSELLPEGFGPDDLKK